MVVHRDVKPVNCLLNIDHSIVKLADFGISVKLNHDQMVQGKRGTSAYMSPEVLDGMFKYFTLLKYITS